MPLQIDLGYQARKALGPNPNYKVAILYRHIVREIPRILMIYDLVHYAPADVKQTVRKMFMDRAHIKDPRIIQHLVNYGYYELEETMFQHKQKHHLLQLLDGMVDIPSLSKRVGPDEKISIEQQELKWLDPH
ncbi:hypothetical protein ACA910_013871 [Epithemia clementina (nom. ined.)]